MNDRVPLLVPSSFISAFTHTYAQILQALPIAAGFEVENLFGTMIREMSKELRDIETGTCAESSSAAADARSRSGDKSVFAKQPRVGIKRCASEQSMCALSTAGCR